MKCQCDRYHGPKATPDYTSVCSHVPGKCKGIAVLLIDVDGEHGEATTHKMLCLECATSQAHRNEYVRSRNAR